MTNVKNPTKFLEAWVLEKLKVGLESPDRVGKDKKCKLYRS